MQTGSIHPHRRLRRDPAPGFYAADAVPGVFGVGLFALAFVAFEEAGDEELFGEGGELDAAAVAVGDDF